MKNKYLIALSIFLLFSLAACNDFLDVEPKGVLVEGELLNDDQGFKDAMYGVYATMAQRPQYGENLTYGFTDKLGQLFIRYLAAHEDSYITKYDYLNAAVRHYTDTIWSSQYRTISYVNNVLKQLEANPRGGDEMNFVKGEAHALRAFLHFDIARLYADDIRRNPTAQGIPYAFNFDLKNKELTPLAQTYKYILNDLTIAEKLLEKDEVINTSVQNTNATTYLRNRFSHCNKYAVKAIKARVYYSMGKLDSAAFYASEVINSKTNFELTASNKFNEVKRYPNGKELIFGLSTTLITQNLYDLFLIQTVRGNFTQTRDDLATLYNTASFTADNTDVRYLGYYTSIQSKTYAFTRFLQSESDMRINPTVGIPLIRLPEMYYILAESVYDTDREKAISTLNEVRKSRGLLPINPSLVDTREKFEIEMRNERMREMPGEGQVFYALKYYNREFSSVLNGSKIEPSVEKFVLPWPQRELDFGNK